jgi:CRP-like cAMP-binding protein/ABC-type transporter Mla MlaB component
MSRTVVRRAYHLDEVQSRRARDPASMKVIARDGHRVLVLELEGPLFFGTAEKLVQFTDAVIDGEVNCLVLDLARVNEIDSTGAAILIELNDRLVTEGCELVIAGHAGRDAVAEQLRDLGVLATVTTHRIFDDLDHTMEWTEDRLILAETGAIASPAEFPLDRLDMFAGLDAGEIAQIAPRLARRACKRGDVLLREGAASRELYIIAKGAASAYLRLPDARRPTRLITFTTGTVFGELALLDEETRSATVQADEFMVCYVLSQDDFTAIAREHPGVAIKLLANLGRELSGRLRRANRAICQLAD